jgi:hypothetical protein
MQRYPAPTSPTPCRKKSRENGTQEKGRRLGCSSCVYPPALLKCRLNPNRAIDKSQVGFGQHAHSCGEAKLANRGDLVRHRFSPLAIQTDDSLRDKPGLFGS